MTDPQIGEATTSWALLQQFEWSRRSTWALLGVIACVLVRDIGYIVRLRILSFQSSRGGKPPKHPTVGAFALTPSVVGGSAVAGHPETRRPPVGQKLGNGVCHGLDG